MISEAQAKANAKYVKENQRQIMVKVNRKTEPEMLKWIEQHDNLQGYIKSLILADMEKHRNSSTESST